MLSSCGVIFGRSANRYSVVPRKYRSRCLSFAMSSFVGLARARANSLIAYIVFGRNGAIHCSRPTTCLNRLCSSLSKGSSPSMTRFKSLVPVVLAGLHRDKL